MIVENNNYTVYMHVNKKNNKKYIGITRQRPEIRWSNGLGYKTQPFYNAIQKYGWNGFDHLILYEGLNHVQACEYEKELIAEYNTTDRYYGYNCSDGGEDVISYYNNLVHQNKTVYQYSFDGNYLRKFESIVSAVRFLGEENIYASTNISRCAHSEIGTASAYGYVWSFTYCGLHIQKYDLLSKRQTRNIKIYQYDLSGRFIASYNSQQEASIKYGISSASISDALDKPHRKCVNYQWRTYYCKNGIELFATNPDRWKSRMKSIVRINKIDLSITIYNSVKEAINELNLKKDSSISGVLNKSRTSAYGYFWCFYDEYIDGTWNKNLNCYRTQRPVYVYNPLCELVSVHESIQLLIKEFDDIYNIKLRNSCICNVCNNKQPLYDNLVFSYTELSSNEILNHYMEKIEKENKIKKQVNVYDLECNFIKRYDSVKEVSRNSLNDFGIKLSASYISLVCNGKHRQYNGFTFSYTEIKEKHSIKPSNHTTQIFIYNFDLKLIAQYKSQSEAERKSKKDLGINLCQSVISDVCRKEGYGLYNDYIISKNELTDLSGIQINMKSIKHFYVYNLDLLCIKEYKKIGDLLKNSNNDIGVTLIKSSVYAACNGKNNGLYKGYIFSYVPLYKEDQLDTQVEQTA